MVKETSPYSPKASPSSRLGKNERPIKRKESPMLLWVNVKVLDDPKNHEQYRDMNMGLVARLSSATNPGVDCCIVCNLPFSKDSNYTRTWTNSHRIVEIDNEMFRGLPGAIPIKACSTAHKEQYESVDFIFNMSSICPPQQQSEADQAERCPLCYIDLNCQFVCKESIVTKEDKKFCSEMCLLNYNCISINDKICDITQEEYECFL